MSKIYYVRHGQSEYNEKQLLAGNTDTILTLKGKQQANEASEKLKDIKFDLAIVSPLKRAIETFDFINKYHNLTPIIDERIKERNFGQLEGKSIAEEDRSITPSDLFDLNLNSDFESNVEKMQDMYKRVKNSIDEIVNKYFNKNILIVAHGGVGRFFEAYFNGMPENGILLTGPKNAEIRIYEF
jgi:broad specificity phosphatase PhoE